MQFETARTQLRNVRRREAFSSRPGSLCTGSPLTDSSLNRLSSHSRPKIPKRHSLPDRLTREILTLTMRRTCRRVRKTALARN